MELQFWGAAQAVTGSIHLLTINGQTVLLDCGRYQGRRKEAFERNRKFPFEPSKLDALILSHAYRDHSGNIPTLVKQGYTGPIWATPASRWCPFLARTIRSGPKSSRSMATQPTPIITAYSTGSRRSRREGSPKNCF